MTKRRTFLFFSVASLNGLEMAVEAIHFKQADDPGKVGFRLVF
jgi:hypothetical protein